ncbi:class I SAM-dependent methyltransferase [Virgibacillus sp. MSJ-26]|uniref:tRNA (adenine(22)-N(1))-methyltransferase n=1 Tax=Virgibacillus sp. MSJ-26 TaxID=2841522 RepID=UPI001C10CF8F|nr:class I SAM-dependent methyltransferase [Virgibacillus sp. MSJ-26]MBU5466417.1 class I SAM-dependent methyltransferase [Virgibacillus sp. MSJ-26]
MKEEITVPRRLKTLSFYLSQGAKFADIGSDHALLPIYTCLNDSKAIGIAGEVNKGPYERAKDNVKQYQLSHVIDVRLGNGLAIIQPNEISELVIAGMGGPLITSILEEGKGKLASINKLILQPNIHARKVRYWLFQNNFQITEETILKENGHFYEIIVGEFKSDTSLKNMPYERQEKDFIFGPILLQNKTSLFKQKWSEEKENIIKIINQMKKATVKDDSKIMQFEKELNWIEEVLS